MEDGIVIAVGVVGAGTMGLFHTNGYKEIPEAEVRAVFDLEEARARKFAEQHGIELYPSIGQMLEDSEIEIIDICTPTPSHKEIFLRAIEAGKHVFCEKPLARTLREAEEILTACHKGGKKYSVGHVLRFFQEYETIRKLLDAGDIGTPRLARACRCVELPPSGPAWFFDLDASGGVILDLIVHDFDFLLWCFGEVERVFARGLYACADPQGDARVDRTAMFATEPSPPRRGADERVSVPGKDYSLVTLAFKNGVIAHVEGSWVYPGGFYMALEVAGSEGVLRYDSRNSVPLKVLGGKRKEAGEGVEVPESPVKDSPYARELRAFVNSCLNNTEPEVSVDHALESVRICDAAYRSIISGRPVEL